MLQFASFKASMRHFSIEFEFSKTYQVVQVKLSQLSAVEARKQFDVILG